MLLTASLFLGARSIFAAGEPVSSTTAREAFVSTIPNGVMRAGD